MSDTKTNSNNDIFDSSDSNRGAFELKYAQQITFDEPLPLEHGGQLLNVTVAFETYGALNEAKDNAVLICHALTGDSHVARHNDQDSPGWWDLLIGPGKSLDTNKYFVICPNILGGCRGTTGPNSINPETNRPYGADFPIITIGDMVNAQVRMIDKLGIKQLLAVIGGSMGGMLVLEWAIHQPTRLKGAVTLATAARMTAQGLAFNIVGRNAIVADPGFNGGQFYEPGCPGPLNGLAIARMMGHITYLSRESMMRKFDPERAHGRNVDTIFETIFSVGSYLAHQAERFNERFDANTYRAISLAIDYYDLGGTVDEVARNLCLSSCRWLMMSFTSDWLFPAIQTETMVNALIECDKQVSFCNIESDCGHDAFLLPNQLSVYGGLIHNFLRNLRKQRRPGVEEFPTPIEEKETETELKWRNRPDYNKIINLIPPESSVLDLGCGNGELLIKLRNQGNKKLMGIERNERCIQTCVSHGFDVVQCDLNHGLYPFRDKQFDYVVLSYTLQSIMDVEKVMEEMLRVGQKGIVSFPNAGYKPWRDMLCKEGHMPKFDPHNGATWYNTDATRFFTISDFQDFCDKKGYRILKQVALDTIQGCKIESNCNENANMAIVVLSR